MRLHVLGRKILLVAFLLFLPFIFGLPVQAVDQFFTATDTHIREAGYGTGTYYLYMQVEFGDVPLGWACDTITYQRDDGVKEWIPQGTGHWQTNTFGTWGYRNYHTNGVWYTDRWFNGENIENEDRYVAHCYKIP